MVEQRLELGWVTENCTKWATPARRRPRPSHVPSRPRAVHRRSDVDHGLDTVDRSRHRAGVEHVPVTVSAAPMS